MAELRAVSGLFNGINQRLRAGAARHMGFSEGDFRLLNVRTLLQTLFHAFDAVAAGEAIQRQVDSVRHK